MQTDDKAIDKWLLISTIFLMSFGLIMVLSSSLAIAEKMKLSSYYFAYHQAIYMLIGCLTAIIVSFIPIKFVRDSSSTILLVSILLLISVLIPGITRPINGSYRWLFLGSMSIQPSEFAKITLIIYMASYMVRRNYKMRNNLTGFFVPMTVLGIIALLLLLEPDFGSVVVLALTVLGMLFLGGVHYSRFLILLPGVLCTLAFFAISSSYRVARFTSFWNPWIDQFNTGYQLVQSLIAIGRGGLTGIGLGGSVQKMLYLPEAHTDFIVAVVAEELGILGVLCLMLMFFILVYRIFEIGRNALNIGHHFSGNLCFGIGLLFGSQFLINIGVNIGLLPTKGITLPLISYGGSSIVMSCIAIGLILRVDFENKII